MNILFVCSGNKLRSPTAEHVFAQVPGWSTMSAGTNPDAETTVSLDLIEWADLIAVMESGHKRKLNERFRTALRSKRIVVLSIPDDYTYMEPALIELLWDSMSRVVDGLTRTE